MSAKPKVLLFDLGGVVIDIDFAKVFAVWAKYASCDIAHIRSRFRMDDRYKAHETGQINGSEFFAGLRTSLEIDLTDDQFLEGWNAIFVGEVQGMARLLKSAAHHFPLFAFSNTNEIHRQKMFSTFAPILGNFGKIFISSDIGLRKPDPAAFLYVAKDLGLPPSNILFFDDTQENVKGAQACGLDAVWVRSLKDVIDARIT